MRCCGWDLKTIAGFQRARRLTFNGKLKTAFQNIGRFDTRMRVEANGYTSLNFRLHEHGYVTRRRSIDLRQDLPRHTRRCCRRRALRRRAGCDKLCEPAKRATRNPSKTTSGKHGDLLNLPGSTLSKLPPLSIIVRRLGGSSEPLIPKIAVANVAPPRAFRVVPTADVRARDCSVSRLQFGISANGRDSACLAKVLTNRGASGIVPRIVIAAPPFFAVDQVKHILRAIPSGLGAAHQRSRWLHPPAALQPGDPSAVPNRSEECQPSAIGGIGR